MNKVASPRQVASFARGMSDAYLRCRDIGHQWRLYYQRKDGSNILRKMYCPSCKTDRRTKINRYGEVVSNHYTYDQGYLIEGLGRVQGRSKSVLRVEAINRSPEIDLDYTIFEEPGAEVPG